MAKTNVLPAVNLSVALIISSTILTFAMNKLGEKTVNAGIFSSGIELQNRNNYTLKIVLDDASELELHSGQDAKDKQIY